MNRRIFLFGLMGAPLAAQETDLGGPVLGYVFDEDRHVRPLIGPAGSAYLAPPLAEDTALRQWTGSYGLDTEGQLYFGAGTRQLRRVESEGGWQKLVASARPDVAIVQQGGRVAIARSGVADDALELGMVVEQVAIGMRGEAIAGADSERFALWRADGRLVFQAAMAGVRALQVLPGGAGVCGLADSFFIADEAGHQMVLPVGQGSALALTGDGATALVLNEEGSRVHMIAIANREWQEAKTPMAGRELTPLRDGRSFLLTGRPGEPAWTLTLRDSEPQWSQVPLLRGGQR